MGEIAIDFRSSCQQEEDGSLTVLIQITGLPDVAAANMVSRWMQQIIQQNAAQIGRRGNPPAAH